MIKKLGIILLIILMITMSGCEKNKEEKIVVGIGWSNTQDSYSFISTLKAVEEAGGIPLVLEMVRTDDLEYDAEGKLQNCTDENGMLDMKASDLIKENGYKHSNIEKVMEGIDCLILPGGVDMSSYLYKEPEESHTIEDDLNYCAERDVSDYLLTQYCLDKDIPLLAICRGMQVLCIVSGAKMIQDIGTWFKEKGIEYHYQHRSALKDEFVPHEITIIDKDSLLYKLMKKDEVKGCPSWHHQAVESLEGTDLSVTAYTNTEGIDMIEAVERKDRSFVIGVQCHPEVAVKKHIDNEANANDYTTYDDALILFKTLIEKVKLKKADEFK